MVKPSEKLPPKHSGVRSLVEGDHYQALESLADARGQADAVVIFEGDDGGTIYLTVPVDQIACDEPTLQELLADVDAICWADSSSSGMFFECRAVGSSVAGGMGGGLVTAGLWLHRDIEHLGLRSEIQEVLAGCRPRLDPTERSWNSIKPRK